MKNYFAKKSWASYVMLGTLVFAIVALIMSVMSDSNGQLAGNYGVESLSAVIAVDVVAIVLSAASFVLDGMFTGKLFSLLQDVIRFAVAAFLIAGMALMISTRGELMGFIWFSSLLADSETGVAALNDAVASWVFYVLGLVCIMVSVFVSLNAKKQAKTEAGTAA